MTPLSEDDVRAAASALREEQVDAVAVSCLWSFRNPAHEQRIGEILQEELPDAYVSLSTEVLPQIRVYERHSTTALNAYVGPVLKRYLVRLEEELAARGFGGTLLIMQSNGGVMSPALAQRFASNTLLSGPAGGPLAGIHYGDARLQNAITVDMGGTSFDVALVSDGVPDGHDRGRDRRPPDRLADPRHPHRRRRRRLDRLDRQRRPARGRPGQRGRRTGPRVLRPRRHAADRHRRRPAARLPGPDASSTAAS